MKMYFCNTTKNYGTQKKKIIDPELVWNSNNHLATSITLDELEKALKLTKNGKSP
jgi:hypothetical protein